ncbi:MAG TPA: 16S rRNA (guanine(966)-N(2))-methyltransferase RsmD [Rhodothermales bacterium]|nr:16S rRNA (guanine(966)-N(2))-methyltransferase RsmD [Rhodothermales bacterium]
MRIIAGRLKGRRLRSPRGVNTRPTADRVRESVFNLIQARTSIEKARVLDAFCGTGAFGFEAISRGAANAVFVDSSPAALKIAALNAESLGVSDQCLFLRRDVMRHLKRPQTPKFDLIFADPPYGFDRLDLIPALALDALSEDGLLILEHDKTHRFDVGSRAIESRSYGRTIVTIFRVSVSSEADQSE